LGAVLSVDGVRHRRGGREVLRIDGLEVEDGERLGVLGLNGAGKTSLLRLLAAVDVPAAGEVRVDGVTTSAGGATLRRRIAYVTQRPVLLSMSVRRNVELPLRYRKVPRPQRRADVEFALARLRIEHLADRPATALSAGESQRVSLARALACRPEALLLDEPAASLDTPARAAFLADVEAALADWSVTVALVSHRAEEILPLCDRVAALVDGQIRQLAPADELVARPADAAVARLVGYDNVVEVDVGNDGQVLIAGHATGLHSPQRGGHATLAVWATAVRVHPPGARPLTAVVERVNVVQGRRELVLAAGARLRAQLALDAPPPTRGSEVSVDFDRAHARLLGAAQFS
jgi:tungstate transport system ATP-binding protein